MRLNTVNYLCTLLLFTLWGCVVPDSNNSSVASSSDEACSPGELWTPTNCETDTFACMEKTFEPLPVTCARREPPHCSRSSEPDRWCKEDSYDPEATCGETADPTGCIIREPIHDYEFCGMASSEEECQQMGCDLVLNGLLGSIEGDACLLDSNQPWEHACFKNNGTRREMSWGNLTSFYVREKPDGSFEVLFLNALYDDALHDWTNCQDLPNSHPCHSCL